MLKQQSVLIPRWISWQMHLARRTRRYQDHPPAIGQIDFGELRQTQVLGRDSDSADSQAVESYYNERFLRREARILKGRALEIGKDHYTSVVAERKLTITSLAFTDDTELIHRLADVKDNAYDVLLLVQVLQLVYDLHALVRHIHRILVPGGILLATVPGTCYADGRVNEMKPYWGFTNFSLRKLIETVFPPRRINIENFGNVLVAMVHLYRLGFAELTQKELNLRDNHYPLLLTLKAQKASA
jgi:SAM-dependent methyltransferase